MVAAVLYSKTDDDGMICMKADVDGVMVVVGIDDGSIFVFSDEMDGFVDREVFCVGAIVDKNWGIGDSIIYCGLNGCVITWSCAADIEFYFWW